MTNPNDIFFAMFDGASAFQITVQLKPDMPTIMLHKIFKGKIGVFEQGMLGWDYFDNLTDALSALNTNQGEEKS